ncbi:lipoprotein NlpD precursor [Candidatus Blochmanniella floridana]|uniref:Murein hydrolase activator NlpD n=1 Tax=Blochmanniella floridana TaxID=203907 RepID=Q7VQG4_BLOFL|nr:lipoprotein NlpD precursor [Candidatus Blochmannia floridanus]
MLDSIFIIYKAIIYIFLKLFFLVDCNFVWYDKYFINLNMVEDLSQTKQYTQWSKKRNCFDHEYSNVNRSSYRNSIYIVKPGDTLFYIAWITGNNYLDLAKNNSIKDINILKTGQILRVHQNVVKMSSLFFFKKKYMKNFLIFNGNSCCLKKIYLFLKQKYGYCKDFGKFFFNTDRVKNSVIYLNKSEMTKFNSWYWPALGQVIRTVFDSEGGNKGIDIVGIFDQPVLAATHGQVIYVGDALQGYGNLIIIKHDNNYLSAYAHNNKVFVSEKQHVNVGDQIATMGNSGTNEVKLYFEIRHKGKSVDPLHLMPNINK